MKEFTIKINYDIRDELMKQFLLDDYDGTIHELKYLKKKGYLEQYQQEDYDYHTDLKEAFERLLRFYLPVYEANKLIGEKNAEILPSS